MGLYVRVYDSVLKKTRMVAYPGFYVYKEQVSGSAKSIFTLGMTIDSSHEIEVSIDGREQPIENTNWTRNTTNGTITTSEPVNVGSVFKAKVYLK